MSKNIDQITRTISTITGSMRFALRDGTVGVDDEDGKAIFTTLVTFLSSGVLDTYVQGLIDTAIQAARLGTIELWGAAAAPTGALLCQGQTLDSVADTEYAGLYGKIGTTFGGTGADDFQVPDFRAAHPRGAGTSTQFADNVTIVLGTGYNDAGQRLTGQIELRRRYVDSSIMPGASGVFTRNQSVGSVVGSVSGDATTYASDQLEFDSADSTSPNAAKTNDQETLVKAVGINFIIWYE